MITVSIAPEFKEKWPDMQLYCLECNVAVQPKNEALWLEIVRFSRELRTKLKIEQISKLPAVASSRKGYKAVGKDPARYRLSAEALMRRVLKGNDLYQINNVVDIVNLASASSGFSIGGYDVEKIVGEVTLGIGNANEAYTGLGRVELNIEYMPILRDQIGAFGSPTSDSERTCVAINTRRFLMVYFGFGAHDSLDNEVAYAEELLCKFGGASNIEKIKIITG